MPVKIVKPLKDIRCMEKETVTFECELNKPDVPVEWLFKGKPIKPSDGFEVACDGTKHTLTIPKTMLDQVGEFTIKAEKAKSAAKLIVDGKYPDGYG